MQTLLSLADDEAVEYLREVDESTIVEDYFVLSKRLGVDALTALCREFLGRRAFRARLLGITQLGTILQGSYNREVSIELARVVRNANEDDGIRECAYSSLKLINVGNTSQLLEYLESSLELSSTTSQRIDWDFVDSFLK